MTGARDFCKDLVLGARGWDTRREPDRFARRSRARQPQIEGVTRPMVVLLDTSRQGGGIYPASSVPG